MKRNDMTFSSRLVRFLLICFYPCLLAHLPASAAAQTGVKKDVKVAGPTRLDWQFAASSFGKDAARLPTDYDSTAQRYLLFVPGSLKAGKPAPLVVFISPGDGPAGLASYQKVCDKAGMLFCSPYLAGNKCPVGKRVRIVLDVLDDVRRHYQIDPDQTYLAGFSGGGRMACTIAFALPEYFGGVVPICGTNPPPTLSYLRHRVRDRLQVAFVTGATDFNRKETEIFMYPFLRELGVGSKLWVVPGMGHAIPGTDVLAEIQAWLTETLAGRRNDARLRPSLCLKVNEAPTPKEQADRMLEMADNYLKKPAPAKAVDTLAPGDVWRGVALLQGVRARWPREAGHKAAKRLENIQTDDNLLKRVEVEGGFEERLFLLHQAKGLEAFGQKAKALEAWQLLLKLHPDSPEGRQAAEAVRRLAGATRLESVPAPAGVTNRIVVRQSWL
jgi:dienelactone hydrolase